MKTTLITLFAGLTAFTCTAQYSGVVSFAEKIKIEIPADSPAAAMMDSLPKESVMPMMLVFNQDESLYQSDKAAKPKADANMEEGGHHMIVKMDRPQSVIYRDLKNNSMTQQREFMGRKFLVESDKGKSDWKITGRQKTILGYACQEATRQDKDRSIQAWFAPAIPVSGGPGTAGNLPGLILEENINNGKLIVCAVKIDLNTPGKEQIIKPKEGKKMTQEAFDKMVEEKMKEMDMQGNGNQPQIIIRTK